MKGFDLTAVLLNPEFAGMRDTPEFKELLASEPRVL